jgi:tetratricopeptide (TPR) repeat protein
MPLVEHDGPWWSRLALQLAVARQASHPLHEDTVRLAEQVLARAERDGSPSVEAAALIALTHLDFGRGNVASASRRVIAAAAKARAASVPALEARALWLHAILCRIQGPLDESLRSFERARVLYDQAGDSYASREIDDELGVLFLQQGRWAEADACFAAMLELAAMSRDETLRARTLHHLAALRVGCGELDEAEALYHQARALHRRGGRVGSEWVIALNLADVLRLRRSPDARSAYESVLRTVEQERLPPLFRGFVHGGMGALATQEGRLQDAAVHLDHALSLVRPTGYRVDLALILCHQGELLVRQGNRDAARVALREARDTQLALGAVATSELSQRIAEVSAMLDEA